MRLETAADNFERGKVDTFCLKAPDLGQLQAVVVLKEGGGLGADWHVQQVEVLHPGKSNSDTLALIHAPCS